MHVACALLAQFGLHTKTEGEHGRLRCGIHGFPWNGDPRGKRTDVDDMTAPLVTHHTERCARAVDNTKEIHGDNGSNHLIALRDRTSGSQDASTIDPDIRFELSGSRPTLVGRGHVEEHIGSTDICSDHSVAGDH